MSNKAVFWLVLIIFLLSAGAGWAGTPDSKQSLAAVAAEPNGGWGAAWSPRSTPANLLAFLSSAGGLPPELWLYDPGKKSFRRLTSGGAEEPAWSLSGDALSFSTYRRGKKERWQVRPAGGQETPEALPAALAAAESPLPSPDGKKLAYLMPAKKTLDLYLSDPGGENPLQVTEGFTVTSLAWSPQGDRIAFDAYHPLSRGLPQVWLYDLPKKRLAHLSMPGSLAPQWSADGKLIAYSVLYPGQGYRVGIADPAKEIGKPVEKFVYSGEGMAWSPTANLLAVTTRQEGRSQVWVIDGRGKIKRKIQGKERHLRFPAWSADGRTLAFETIQQRLSSASEIWLMELRRGRWTRVTKSQPTSWGLSVAGSRLFFISNRGGKVTGWSAEVNAGAIAPVMLPESAGALQITANPRDGSILLVKPEEIIVLSSDGASKVSFPLAGAVEARWSPQGDRIAAAFRNANAEERIKLLIFKDGKFTETTAFTGRNPAWQPSGEKLVFARGAQLWEMKANEQQPTLLIEIAATAPEEAALFYPAWNQTGDTLLFSVTRRAPDGWRQEIWTYRAGESAKQVYSEVVQSEFGLAPYRYTYPPAWSPDGKRIVFTSDRAGAPQVWQLPPEGGEPQALSPAGAAWPVYSLDGSQLYFVRVGEGEAIWRANMDGSEASPLAIAPSGEK